MRLSSPIKAVLFDLDDTLYDEMTFVASGFDAVANYLSTNFHLIEEEMFLSMMEVISKDGRGKVFDKVLEYSGLYNPKLVDELVSVYRSHQPNIDLYEDVIHIFQELRGLDIKLGIITDGLYSVQKNKVSSLGLQYLVDIIIYTDEIGRKYWKPHPIAFQRAIEELAIEPYEAIYVGNDPTKDFAGPNSIGMRSVHLCKDRCLKESSCEADIHIGSLNEIISALLNQ